MPPTGRVAVVTLGCGRNDVDSDQVAGALAASGHELVDDPADADCVLVNTCTFVEAARAESVEAILDAADPPGRVGDPAPVVVMGCMAQRYRDTLADELPEAAAVVGFGDYARLPGIVGAVLAGDADPLAAAGAGAAVAAPPPSEPMRGLPLLTAERRVPLDVAPSAPPTTSFPVRTEPRGPWAYLKLAGGCDRACTFCTIPSYRGTFASRPPAELLAEARWLVDHGVRELVCVSENTTSYGKDLPQGRDALLALLDGLDGVDGLDRIRLLYLQPDELTDELLAAMAATPVVAPYYDLSLQHASPTVLRRMARGGSGTEFAELIARLRARQPAAVVRSSFIVGFPGETDDDVAALAAFVQRAGVDWPGLFTYSREDGTASAAMAGQVPADEAAARRDHIATLAELAAEDRAATFVGSSLDVLVETVAGDEATGRSHREGPESDGEVRLRTADGHAPDVAVGELVAATVVATDGVDLVAEPVGAARADGTAAGATQGVGAPAGT